MPLARYRSSCPITGDPIAPGDEIEILGGVGFSVAGAARVRDMPLAARRALASQWEDEANEARAAGCRLSYGGGQARSRYACDREEDHMERAANRAERIAAAILKHHAALELLAV